MFYGSDNVREGILPFLAEYRRDRLQRHHLVRPHQLFRDGAQARPRAGPVHGIATAWAICSARSTRSGSITQRGVVQNEKREGRQPAGRAGRICPAREPVPGRPPLSPRDDRLDGRPRRGQPGDVKQWFIDKYGPNNAIVALSGDITVDEAKTLMEKYFGAIPRGPVNNPAQASVPTLQGRQDDRHEGPHRRRSRSSATGRSRACSRRSSRRSTSARSVLGGLASSRLDQILVRDEKIAVSVSADMMPFHRIGLMEVDATVKPGVDPGWSKSGSTKCSPTISPRARPRTRSSAPARSMSPAGPPDSSRSASARIVVAGRRAAVQWRQRFLQEAAGELRLGYAGRGAHGDAAMARPSGAQDHARSGRPSALCRSKAAPAKSAATSRSRRSSATCRRPAQPLPLDFPDVTHVTLSNGIKLAYAQRTAAPLTQVAMAFDAGYRRRRAATAAACRTWSSACSTKARRPAPRSRSRRTRSGSARCSAAGGIGRPHVGHPVGAEREPCADLALMADIVRNPAFNPAEVERVRTELAHRRPAGADQPQRHGAARLHGAGVRRRRTPMERPRSATKPRSSASAATIWWRSSSAGCGRTRRSCSSFPTGRWPRSRPLLSRRSATGAPPAVPAGQQDVRRARRARDGPADRADRPAGLAAVGDLRRRDDAARPAFRRDRQHRAAATCSAAATSSRINQDLRETKGWAYSPYSTVVLREKCRALSDRRIGPVRQNRRFGCGTAQPVARPARIEEGDAAKS